MSVRRASRALCLVVGVLSQQQIITTIVGDYVGDGGAGTNATLNFPQGVAVDAAGNVLIADTHNNRLRLLTKSTGVISTIVGYGGAFLGSDGVAGTSAPVSSPGGVALDAVGNAYIADTGNHRVCVWNTQTGIITTIAGFLNFPGFSGDGGTGTFARLNSPQGVAVDAAGNVFIADTSNNRVRLWTKSTGIITTIAGGGSGGDGGAGTSASLSSPYSVSVDAVGNAYIADSGNGRVRLLNVSSGIITTLAGGGSGGDGGAGTSASLSSPRGVAVDSAGNVYIADMSHNRVRLWNASRDVISTIAGIGGSGAFSGDGGAGANATLYNPCGVAVDVSGNAYIVDTSNHRVRLLNRSTGRISTTAGNGDFSFSGDGGAGTSAKLNLPSGVAADALGNVYIADTNNHRVRLWTKSTGITTTLVGTGAWAFSGDGGAGTNTTLYFPRGVAIDTAGNVFIADLYNFRVRMWNSSSGIVTSVMGNGVIGFSGDGGMGSSASINFPSGIAVDVFGNAYIADNNHRVRLWNASTGIISTIIGTGAPGFSGDGGAGTNASLYYPNGVAVDLAGNVYVADAGNYRVRLWSKRTGIISTIVGTGSPGFSGDGGAGTSTTLSCSSVAVDLLGNAYIVDTYNNRLRMWTKSTGVITSIAGYGSYGFSGDGGAGTSAALGGSFGVAVDALGSVIIADTNNYRVRVLAFASPNPTSSAIATSSPHTTQSSSASVSAMATPTATPSASRSAHPTTTSTSTAVASPSPNGTPTASPSASLGSHPIPTSTAAPTPSTTPSASSSPPAISLIIGASTSSAAAGLTSGPIAGIVLGSVAALGLVVAVAALAQRKKQVLRPLSSAQNATNPAEGELGGEGWAQNPLSKLSSEA